MGKYVVSCAIPVLLTIKVEAEDEDSAIDEAMQYASLINYVGNGGYDKLVGTRADCVSLEPLDDVLEGNGFSIEVEQQ